jgi:ferredoxin
VRAARCLRRRGGGCNACVLACPAQAVWFDGGGRWRVDASACDACGACVSACPSQALDAPWLDLAGLRRAWRDAGSDGVTLGCPASEAATVRVPCLAGLHPELLAGCLVRHPTTPVTLDVVGCEGCAKGALRGVIEAQALAAASYANLLGAEPPLRLASERPPPDPPRQRFSRRELFRRARERGAGLVTTALAVTEATGHPGAALPHRTRLLAAARAHTRSTAAAPTLPVLGAFFVDWEVTAACAGCPDEGRPRCVRACPNGAWRVGGGAATAALSHDAASCSGCGACARACPHAALTPRPAPVTADAGRLPKRSIPRSRCRVCRRAAAGEAGLCSNCRKRRQLEAERSATAAR